MSKVSIILPSLNVASYIRQTMESVCNQTLQDIEILCVDAGSTDGTLEILEEFTVQDPRVRIVHSEKKSYGYQMNLGIAEAKGAYIGIVETDDYIDARMYEVLWETAKEYDAEVVKSDFDMFTTMKNGEDLLVSYSLRRQNRVSYDTLYSKEKYLSGEFTVECYIWNAIYSKDFLQKYGIRFNETPGASFQDFGFKYQVAFAAERLVAVNQSFYRYRRDNSGSSTYNGRTAEFNLRESKFLISVLNRWGTDERVYAAAAREILQLAVWPYMELCKWNEPALGTKDALEEYRNLFLEFEKKNYIDEKLVDGSLWLCYHLFLRSVEAFDGYVAVTSKLESQRIRSYLQEMASKKQIVLYGSGIRGTAIFAFLGNNRCDNIVAFCDGNEEKWGSTLHGLEIFSPEAAVQSYPDATYVITSPGAQKEMRKRLEDLQVKESSIVLYTLQTDPIFCTNCMISPD